jgi:hypothetical protein
MSPLGAVLRGAALVRRDWRVWALVWAATLAFAALLVLPAAALLHANLGHSLYAARMFGNFDMSWVTEYGIRSGGVLTAAFKSEAAALALVYLLLMTFLTGGALAVFTGTAPFWSGCGRYFSRLARLLPYAFACYGLVFAANYGLEKAGTRLWAASMEERPAVIYGWARMALVLLLLLLVNMIFDYAKIRIVASDVRSAWRAAAGAFRFVAANFRRATAVYGLISLAGLALAAAWWALSGALPRSHLAWLVFVLLAQQVCVALRVCIRLLYLAAQVAFSRPAS